MEKKSLITKYNFTKYLPVFVILLAISIMVGSTFAYFTDKTDEESELTFSKVELSGETTTGINGRLRDVIPGTPLVDGALKFSKSIDSEAIYVRAKISFSLPTEYKDDADMISMVDMLRSATDFNIVSEAQHGAVWSAKDGNYFYLVSSADNTKLMRVDTIDTYVLSEEVVVPRDLENLPDNAQYMKGVNFHVAFEAIQADNVSSVLSETKETFNVLFPENEAEKYVDNGNNGDDGDNGDNEEDDTVKVSVTLKGFDGASDLEILEVSQGEVLSEPVVNIPLDENNEPTHVIEGWYTDSALTNKYNFGATVEDGLTLYPKALQVSKGLEFNVIRENSVESAYRVSGGNCQDSFVVIPATYKGLPVIEVADNGFYGFTTLENIYLPNSVKNIGALAFYECENLALTEFPNSVTQIGAFAFNNCTLLPSNSSVYYLPIEDTNDNIVLNAKSFDITSVEWPENVTMIAGGAFYGCTNLEITSLPSGLKSIGIGAFLLCNLVLTELPAGLIEIGDSAFNGCTNVVLTALPASVETIGEGAFSGTSIPSNSSVYYLPIEGTNENIIINAKSTDITSVEWPDNVTWIANSAFRDCTSLAITSLPSTVTKIDDSAFNGCTSLALTELPAGLETIEYAVFQNCTNLALTSLPSGITSIGEYAFLSCVNLKLTSLPDGITKIGDSVFEGCTNLALTSLPAGLTFIGRQTFRNCTSLALTELPAGLTKVGQFSFYKCTSLALTELPAGLTSIEYAAFENCSNLALTSLPSALTSINNRVFSGCTSLALTELPAGLTSIGFSVFENCSNLALTSLPAGLTSIGFSAFENCSKLALTSLPASLEIIDRDAFNGCTLLPSNSSVYYLPIEGTNKTVVVKAKSTDITSVEWPENVTIIAGGAFQGCANLALTELPSGVTSICDYAFDGCAALNLTSLPSSVTYLGSYAFKNCTLLNLTSLPSGITYLGSYVFQNCTNLVVISIPAGVETMYGYLFNGCTNFKYVLCESDEVATLMQGKGVNNTYIYSLQESGYDATGESAVVVSDSVTIYTNTIDGVKWVRTSDNRYFKCIV